MLKFCCLDIHLFISMDKVGAIGELENMLVFFIAWNREYEVSFLVSNNTASAIEEVGLEEWHLKDL